MTRSRKPTQYGTIPAGRTVRFLSWDSIRRKTRRQDVRGGVIQRFSKDVLDTVDMESAAYGLSRNEFINQCIYALKNMVEEKE